MTIGMLACWWGIAVAFVACVLFDHRIGKVECARCHDWVPRRFMHYRMPLYQDCPCEACNEDCCFRCYFT